MDHCSQVRRPCRFRLWDSDRARTSVHSPATPHLQYILEVPYPNLISDRALTLPYLHDPSVVGDVPLLWTPDRPSPRHPPLPPLVIPERTSSHALSTTTETDPGSTPHVSLYSPLPATTNLGYCDRYRNKTGDPSPELCPGVSH